MFILPHSVDLDFGRRPYITYLIVVVCLAIHFFQQANRDAIQPVLLSYCESIYDESLSDSSLDWLKASKEECQFILDAMHSYPEKQRFFTLLTENDEIHQNYTYDDLLAITELIQKHYDKFSQEAPDSLDARLVYDPASLNPVKIFTSALAHADWWHVIGNLIFFVAFASILEILIGSSIKYILILSMIAIATHLTYSITTFINGTPVPTLGLSGVVMGMIGLSAYLMPHAKIRTFVWFFLYVRNLYIPAWILAAWYIGWDSYDLIANSDNGGVNLIAHVSGGITGYLIGWRWLKGRREEIQEELDDEIETRRSLRVDRSVMADTNRAGQKRIANQLREHYAKQKYNRYTDRLYQLVRSGNDSRAILLMLQDYDMYRGSAEIYETLFLEMAEQIHRRSIQCLGRLCIDLLLEERKYTNALAIADACFNGSKSFVLADPEDVVILACQAQKRQQYRLAYNLACNAQVQYGKNIDVERCQAMTAELLKYYLVEIDTLSAAETA